MNVDAIAQLTGSRQHLGDLFTAALTSEGIVLRPVLGLGFGPEEIKPELITRRALRPPNETFSSV